MEEAIEFLPTFIEWARTTKIKKAIPSILIVFATWIIIKKVLWPLFHWFHQRMFIKRKVYKGLSFMESADVYYAINQFIPTRFSSTINTGNDDEPAPVYIETDCEKDPLLIERFCKFEFDIKNGKKYYLCLADCGMGKTTFLINLYYRILKQKKYKCYFVSLQESSYIELIKNIQDKEDTILLLDALDENKNALTNYNEFMEELEKETHNFYRIVITSRTNFFENETKEQLSGRQKIGGTTLKMPEVRKFYITPFTDEDIKRFLKLRYRFRRKKQKAALKLIMQNKNLSVRPLLLRFIDEALSDNETFEYDFQLYEYLFQKWCERERNSLKNELYDECLNMAKIIYYQWLKNGQIGIPIDELPKKLASSLKTVQLKGHPMLNRTNGGVYKFSHKSYWEYMLAKLALSDTDFSCELLINNFDRAVNFMDEMIQYYQLFEEKQTSTVLIGIADYYMKYKKPEEAEREYINVLAKLEDMQDKSYLLALIGLSKCFQHQLKYESAKKTLSRCKILLDKLELNEDTILVYSQFGIVLSEYCRANHLEEGQIFLKKIINYCTDYNIINYSLLWCYESYCRCCINYRLHQDALEEMREIKEQHFEKDQYALYLWNRAQVWRMDYGDKSVHKIIYKIVENGKRFMDLYERIVWYCKLGVSGAAIGAWNEITSNCLDNSKDIADMIYNNENLPNPYLIEIKKNVIMACNFLNYNNPKLADLEWDCLEKVIEYMNTQNLQEEMLNEYFLLLDYIRQNDLYTFEEKKNACEKRLYIAQSTNNLYYLVNAYLSLYFLYDSQGNTKDAKLALKQAYKESKKDSKYHMTSNYCNLLQKVLNQFDEEIEKEQIIEELFEITPQIYGNDIRRFNIYDDLQKYFSSKNDRKELYCCRELLHCKFNSPNLKRFYECCRKYNNIKKFQEELNHLYLAKRKLTSDEIIALKDFNDSWKFSFNKELKNLIETMIQYNHPDQKDYEISFRM